LIAALYSADPLGLADCALVVVAPFIGSFIGVVIRRLPDGVSIVRGRSHCEHCGHALSGRDLVPLASWLSSGARCRYCGHRLEWFYPLVELAALAIAVASVAIDRGMAAWVDAVLGWWLLALGWIDLRRWLLPDELTLSLVPVGLAAAWWFAPEELRDRVAGAACGYLGLWVVAWAYRRLRGRDGLGMGDAKLLAAGGAWVGASGLPSVVFGAAVAALAAAAIMAVAGTRLDRYSALPFGAFLAPAIWLVWLFGPIRM
jgi:leader peptidase (prepilin peptidase)/N-methyltransferase